MRNFKVHLILLHHLVIKNKLGIDLVNTATDVIKIPTSYTRMTGYAQSYLAATYDIVGMQKGKAYTIRLYARYGDHNEIYDLTHDRASITTQGSHYAFNMSMVEEDFYQYPMDNKFPKTTGYELNRAEYCKNDMGYRLTDIAGEPLCSGKGTMPEITLHGGNPYTLYRGHTFTEPGYVAMDLEDGDITRDVEITGTINPHVLGVQTLIYSVTDSDSNTTRVARNVIVRMPNVPPVITLNADTHGNASPITLREGETWTDPGATATDYEDGDVTNTLVVGGDTVDTNTPGTYNITYRATDIEGLSSVVTREVIVQDNMLPVIILNPDQHGVVSPIDVPSNGTWVDPGATATDTEDGNLTSSIVVSGDTVDTSVAKTYRIVYSVTDNNGATVSVTRVVNVLQGGYPLVTLNPLNGITSPILLPVGGTYTEMGATAIDPEDGDITSSIVVSGDTVDTSIPGHVYTITYTATDSNGHAGINTRTVRIAGNQAPTITLNNYGTLSIPSPVTLSLGDTWIEPGYSAIDPEDGDITSSVVIGGDTVNTDVMGTYNITYSVTDSSGLTTTVTRVVNITDHNTQPYIYLTGDNPQELFLHDPYVEGGAVAYDAEDGYITDNIVIDTSDVDVNSIGTYHVTYRVTDSMGLEATPLTREVKVKAPANTAPVITLVGDDVIEVEALPRIATDRYFRIGEPLVDTPIVNGDNANGVKYSLQNLALKTADDTNILTAPYYKTPSWTYNPVADDPLENIFNGNNSDGSYTISNTTIPYVSPAVIAKGNTDARLATLVKQAPSVIDFTHTPPKWTVLHYIDIPAGETLNPDTSEWKLVENFGYQDTWVAGEIKEFTVTSDLAPNITVNNFVEPGYTAMDNEQGDLTADVEVNMSGIQWDNPGEYQIQYNVIDELGSMGSASRTIRVVATTPPELNIIGPEVEYVIRNHTWYDLGYVATDENEGDITSSVVISGDTVDPDTVGTYVIYYNVTNAKGKVATTKKRTVIVVENGIPELVLIPFNGYPSPVITLGGQYHEMGATAHSIFEGDITDQIIISGDTVDTNTLGTYDIVYKVTDPTTQLTNTVTRTVTIADTTAPVITLTEDTSQSKWTDLEYDYDINGSWTELGFTATDHDGSDISANVLVTGDVVRFNIPAVYTLKYTVTGNNGITTRVNRVVTIKDKSYPVITLNPIEGSDSDPHDPYTDVVIIQRNGSYTEPGAIAYDAVDGDISANITTWSTLPDNPGLKPGTYEIMYRVTNSAGRTTDKRRTIVFTDSPRMPYIYLSAYAFSGVVTPRNTPIDIYINSGYNEAGYDARDNRDGNLTPSVIVYGDEPNGLIPNTYLVKYEVTNSAGFVARKTRVVNVITGGLPIITILGDNPITLVKGTAWIDPGVTAYDDEDGDITDNIVQDLGGLDTNTLGTYTLTYTVTDSSGLTTTVNRVVNIIADQPPTITLNEPTHGTATDMYLFVGDTFVDPGYTAIDAEDGDVSANVTVSGDTVNTNIVGDYTITYTVTDSAGNSSSVDRNVSVIDNMPPVITLLGNNPYNLSVGDTYTDPGYTASDEPDGDLTANVIISGDIVDTNVAGVYTVDYAVTDASGTTTTATRIVNVIDNNAPVIQLTGGTDYRILQTPTWVEPGYIATDTEDGDLTNDVVVTGTVDTTNVGQYTLTYTVTDLLGATTEVARVVTVLLDSPLSISLNNPISGPPASPLVFGRGASIVDPFVSVYNPEGEDVSGLAQASPANIDTMVLGDVTRTYIATDPYGRTASITRVFTIVEAEQAPTITLIGDTHPIVVQNTGYTDPGFTASDFEDGDLTNEVVVSGDVVDDTTVGVYDIVYTVTDSANLTATATRHVTVVVNVYPVINLAGGDINVIVNGTYTEPGYSAYDNEDGDVTANVIVDDSSVDLTTVGDYNITYTVTDSDNHETVVSRAVHVLATDEPPVITLYGDNPMEVTTYNSYSEPGYSATDAIDGDLTANVIISGDTVDDTVNGTYNVIYSVTDSAGNNISVNRSVIINYANIAPTITLARGTDINWANGANWIEPGYTAMDVEDGSLTQSVVITGDTVDVNTDGDYTLTYSVTDSGGLTTTVDRIVHVVANTSPALQILPHPEDPSDPYHITLRQGHVWEDPGYIATDNEQGDITDQVVITGDTVDKDTVGVYNIIYTITDNLGLVATKTREVTYTEDQIPAIQLVAYLGQSDPTVVVLPIHTTWNDPGYSATDTEDGIITNDVVISGDTVDVHTAGTYTIIYTVTDSYNQSAVVTREVTILPDQAPTITLNEPTYGTATNMYLFVGDTYVDPGYSATDAEDGDITANVIVSGDTVDSTTPGNYNVIYTVTDSAGHSNTITRHVEVKVNQQPTITLLGDNPMNIVVTGTYTDPGYTANDDRDGDITNDVIISGDTVDTNTIGTYNVIYSVTDSDGLNKVETRVVNINPNQAPVVTLTGDNPMYVPVGGTFTDPGATASDFEDGDLTNNIIVAGDTVDTNVAGNYNVTYTVTDSFSVTTTETRVVTVNMLPTITLTGDNPLVIAKGSPYVEPGYTATDAEDGDISANVIISGDIVDTNTVGSYTITYDVTDSLGGNALQVSRVVNVIINTPPTVTILGDNPMEVTVGQPFTDPGATASDPEEGDVTNDIVIGGDTVDPNTIGTYNIHYTYTDPGGLGDSKTRVVNVVADDAPVITLTGGSPYYIEVNTVYNEPGYSASDTEDGDITANVVVSGDTVDVTVTGDYNVIYTVTDSYGNTTSVTRVVKVVNPPVITLLPDSAGNTDTVYGGISDHNYVKPGVTCVDYLGNPLTPSLTDNVDVAVIGDYTEIYNVIDPVTSLLASKTRTVHILNTLVPELTILGSNPYSQDEDLPYTDAGATATDPISGDVTANIVTSNNLDTTTPGSYTYNYSITGVYGDVVTGVRNITIVSTNSLPTITLIDGAQDYTGLNNGAYVDPGATAYDTEDGDITNSIIVTGTVDVTTLGDNTLSYSVTDSYGDTVVETRTVSVVNLPVITKLADASSQIDPIWVETNASRTDSVTAVDYLGADMSGSIVTTNAADITTEGDYTETYDATDPTTGVTGTATRVVHVKDSLASTITLLGDNPMNVSENSAFTEPGFTATDIQLGDVTANVIVSGDTVDTSVVGVYNITYTYTGNYGGPVTVTRVVNVLANEAPVITLLGDNPMTVDNPSNWHPVDFNGDDAYTLNGYTTPTIISKNAVTLHTSSSGYGLNSIMAQKIAQPHQGVPHTITVKFKRDAPVNLIYYDQDHTDANFHVGFYYGDQPDAMGEIPGAWKYGRRDQAVHIGLPPSPPAPLQPISGIYGVDSTWQSHDRTDVVNNALSFNSSTVWKIEYIAISSTRLDIKVYLDDVLTKHAEITFTGSGTTKVIDPLNTPIEVIYFNVYSYHNSGSETIRNLSITSSEPVAYIEPGATASDTEDGDISNDIVIAGDTVDTTVPATYHVTYNVDDSNGIAATEVIRDVIVAPPNYIPNITLLPDLLGNTTPSNLYQGQGEIVVESTGDNASWFNKYLNTHIGFTGDFDVYMPGGGNACWLILDPDENKSDWASNSAGFAVTPFNGLNNHTNNGWETLALPSGADSITECIVGTRRIGSTLESYMLAPDGSETVRTRNSVTQPLYLHLWQKGPDHRDTKGLVINGSPVTDISDWTTSVSTDWNLADTTKTYYDPGAIAVDVEDTVITSDIVVTGDTVDINTVGTYTVTYTVTDSTGLAASVDRVVNIAENTAPVITLLGDDPSTVSNGYPWNDPGATALDDQEGDVTANIVVSGDTVDTTVNGTYNITYTIKDVVGLEDTVSRVVNVVANQPTVLTLVGDNPLVIVQPSSPYVEPGYSAIDPEDGDITAGVVVGGDTVDINTVGDYNITYSSTDSSGDTVTETRLVQVVPENAIYNESSSIQFDLVDTANAPASPASPTAVSTDTTTTISDTDGSTTTIVTDIT